MSPLHAAGVHESAHLHVTGAARYVADLAGPVGTLWVVAHRSPHASAAIEAVDTTRARAMPGVHAVCTASDVPGHATWGPIVHDEPLLAAAEVIHVGQAVAIVAAETEAQAREAAAAITVRYALRVATLTLDQAVEAGHALTDPHLISRGDLAEAFRGAAFVLRGEVRTPAQDHFYLETQAALVVPDEGGTWRVWSSTQHPTEIQRAVADTLGIGAHSVVVEVPRLGGGFGGKESQATPFACLAALAAWTSGRPCRMVLHRDEDMAVTGKRHPFRARWQAAIDGDGVIRGVEAELDADGGATVDLSGPIVDRALFHVAGSCFLPAARLTGRAWRTNTPSNTAFRGFGGPQGMMVSADLLDGIADRLGLAPEVVLRRNLLGPAPRDRMPYGQHVDPTRLPRVLDHLEAQADLEARRRAIAAFNQSSRHRKRGLGLQAVTFGISFTNAILNQAGASVLLYTDGTVQVNHSGTEMGQGLCTKIRAIVSDVFGVSEAAVRVMPTATDKIPNTVATAASSGSDLNGAAAREAALVVRERLARVAASMVGPDPVFADGRVRSGPAAVPLATVALEAWVRRVPLFATGFYATPGIAYDRVAGQGTPFAYFAFGAAWVEVEVDGLTGAHRVLRADVVHDVGDSLVPTIDRGQIEGAFVQGLGWLTGEDLRVDGSGRLVTHGPSTYKIPAAGDAPLDFRVTLLPDATQPGVVGGSKAVGEPPFMLALAVVPALREAVRAFRPGPVVLRLPATPEAVLRALMSVEGS